MIYIGADHGGFQLKEKMKSWLAEWKIPTVDVGALVADGKDDYPDFAKKVAQEVSKNLSENKGILICRSGGGMEIVANRHPNIRAVYIFDDRSAHHARNDNDANVASFSADWIEEEVAKQSLFTFLNTPFSGAERHKRRIQKIETV